MCYCVSLFLSLLLCVTLCLFLCCHSTPRSYLEFGVLNTHRAVGTTLSHEVTRRFGDVGLPEGTIHVKLTGHAGQSLGAWLAAGVMIELEGDANDYVGKVCAGWGVLCWASRHSDVARVERLEIVLDICIYITYLTLHAHTHTHTHTRVHCA
jgi:GXGXG motif